MSKGGSLYHFFYSIIPIVSNIIIIIFIWIISINDILSFNMTFVPDIEQNLQNISYGTNKTNIHFPITTKLQISSSTNTISNINNNNSANVATATTTTTTTTTTSTTKMIATTKREILLPTIVTTETTTPTTTTTTITIIMKTKNDKAQQQQQQQQQQQHQQQQIILNNPPQTSARTTIKSSPSATNSTLKSHKTDAPMLNYIFDSHLATNKHQHHDRYGPHFDDVHFGNNLINVSTQSGAEAYLNCRISLLQDKTVSWVKRDQNNNTLQLLTVGRQTYTGDLRFSIEFQYPNNWRLKIVNVNKSDEGFYACQISTYPPRVISTYLNINAPEVIIIDEYGDPLIDKYYEVNSTIQLNCVVRYMAMTSSVVYWLHGDNILNSDVTRGGISVKTNLMDNGANSTLSIAKLRKYDSGNYTCLIGPNNSYSITIHVLNGESLAELYHGNSSIIVNSKILFYLHIWCYLFFCLFMQKFKNLLSF